MCDYSLHHVKTRPAKVSDKLTTHNFGTGTEASLHRKMRTWRFACYRGRSCLLQTRLGLRAVIHGRTSSTTKLQSSDRSTKTMQGPITTRWNSRMASSCS